MFQVILIENGTVITEENSLRDARLALGELVSEEGYTETSLKIRHVR